MLFTMLLLLVIELQMNVHQVLVNSLTVLDPLVVRSLSG